MGKRGRAFGVIGVVALVLAAGACVVPPPPPSACTATYGTVAEPSLAMTLVNTTAYSDDEVYVALTGQGTWGAAPCDFVNQSVRLSTLPKIADHTFRFQLGKNIGSGLLWISLGSPITTQLPNVQPSPDTTLYRFANIEFAYPGQGDMTNVNQFSFPIDVETFASAAHAPGTVPLQSTRYNANTCAIVDDLRNTVAAINTRAGTTIADWNHIEVKDAAGRFVRVVAPMQRAKQPPQNGQNPYSQGWPSMVPYLDSLRGQTITVKGLFTPGAGSPYYGQTGWYVYSGAFDPTTGDLTLNGTIASPLDRLTGGTPGATLRVNKATTYAPPNPPGLDGLATGIYDQNSQYVVGGVPRNGFTNGTPDVASPNDVYNSIYRDLTSAFTYGYWGGKYGNDNSAFWATFAPPAAPSGGKPSFAAARAQPDGFVSFSPYSDVLYRYSDAYNIPYGENYGSGAAARPSPLLDLPVGGELRMTIKDDVPRSTGHC